MPDYVREAVFNLLRGHCKGEVVLDLFSGTGAVGLEAISRGAARCIFVERDRTIATLIERNIETLDVAERCEVVRADALGPLALARCPSVVHLIFFDPPYMLVRDARIWELCRAQLAKLIERLDDTGYLVLRTPRPALSRVVDDEEPEGDEGQVDASPAKSKPKSRPKGKAKGKHRDATREADEDGEKMVDLGRSDWSTQDWADAEDLSQDEACYEPANLSIDGAVGPETHHYGKMSMHLYMRRR